LSPQLFWFAEAILTKRSAEATKSFFSLRCLMTWQWKEETPIFLKLRETLRVSNTSISALPKKKKQKKTTLLSNLTGLKKYSVQIFTEEFVPKMRSL